MTVHLLIPHFSAVHISQLDGWWMKNSVTLAEDADWKWNLATLKPPSIRDAETDMLDYSSSWVKCSIFVANVPCFLAGNL